MSVASANPLHLAKGQRKGRTKAALDPVIGWLTRFHAAARGHRLAAGTTFAGFFADAHLNPQAPLITGVVCGLRVETIEDPLMQRIRYMDKLVDDLARGRSMGADPAGLTGLTRRVMACPEGLRSRPAAQHCRRSDARVPEALRQRRLGRGHRDGARPPG
jgi:hypothetical protein